MIGAAGFAARAAMMTSATAAMTMARPTARAIARTAAPMFRPAARILVRLVLIRCVPRLMRTFFDFELRRLREIDLSLEQLFDVAQIAQLVR